MIDKKKMIQELLKEEQLGALILWRPNELVMSLGYQPLLGISLAIFYKSGKVVLYVSCNEPEYLLPKGVDICTLPSGMNDNPWDICFHSIQKDIQESGITDPIGFVEYQGQTSPSISSAESAPVPHNFMDRLRGLSSHGYKDITIQVSKLYAYKDSFALTGIKLAHRVAALGVEAFYHSLDEGKTEISSKIAIESTIMSTIGQQGIYDAQGWACVQAGDHSKDAGTYSITKGSTFQEGDFVMLELAVCVNGYWVDLSRTGFIGTPTTEAVMKYGVVKEAQVAALNCVRAGVRCSDVYHAAMEVFRSHQYEDCFTHALGHGVGYRYHDPSPYLVPSNNEMLEEGMVITIEPGMYGDKVGGGIRIEDNVLVCKHGYELLSKAPRGLQGDE